MCLRLVLCWSVCLRVREGARQQSPLVYQPRLVIYKTFLPSLGEKREDEWERGRERRGRVWFMEETFSLITGRAGLMCTAPMALVTQWWEHTKGLLGGYRVWHIHIGFAAAVDTLRQFVCSKCRTQELNYVAWKSNIQYLCSGHKWICTSGNNIFTK